jgi:uncharacterized protein
MAPAEGALRVAVAFSARPRQVEVAELVLPPGSTVADALRASGLLEAHDLVLESLACGIWGRVQPLTGALRDGDRVELYRPLSVDPKEARRLRYKRQRRA